MSGSAANQISGVMAKRMFGLMAKRISGVIAKRMSGLMLPRAIAPCCLFIVAVLVAGCGHFRTKPTDHFVYVTAKQAYLRDRVAAVSNRTGTVSNGEQLTVLEHGRRFLRVRSPRGEEGWIDEKSVAAQAVDDEFVALARDHAKDPVVGQAATRDEVYLHLAPGLSTERFYRLAEGDKLSLLTRATVQKAAHGPSTPSRSSSLSPAKTAVPKAPTPAATAPAPPPVIPAPPVMEDWWLVRTSAGDTGWIYGGMIDISAPEAIVQYSEGQRFVGTYVLASVNDPGVLHDGQTDPMVPIYVAALSPNKSGLPYDFDQVRVFTWNTKVHRYETAFREKNVEGYLPITISKSADPYGHAANAQELLPTFSYKVLAAGASAPMPDPKTGIVTPGRMITKTYRLEGNIARRILAPGTTSPEEAHPAPEEKKPAAKKKR